ncbi:MAG: flagellar protein FliS [Polaribacter sp.]|jgi:flagellar protein FliS
MNSRTHAALNQYQVASNSSINFASPHELITRLINGALERSAQAKGAMQQNNVKTKGEFISKAVSIIGALGGCLDHEKGGELSQNLESLYEYMIIILTEANINNDVSKIDEAMRLLLVIKGAWVQVPEKLREAQVAL